MPTRPLTSPHWPRRHAPFAIRVLTLCGILLGASHVAAAEDGAPQEIAAEDVAAKENLGSHGYVDSQGVKLHYVTRGKGPLLVLIHGFPDYWYTWRRQIPALSENFQVVALDQRGYNRSDQPKGVEDYAMDKLTGDVLAVIHHFQQERAIVVGHDWGGAVAWSLAMSHPEAVERLIILNLPHPQGLRRELANNPKQQTNSACAPVSTARRRSLADARATGELGQRRGRARKLHCGVSAIVIQRHAELLSSQLPS